MSRFSEKEPKDIYMLWKKAREVALEAEEEGKRLHDELFKVIEKIIEFHVKNFLKVCGRDKLTYGELFLVLTQLFEIFCDTFSDEAVHAMVFDSMCSRLEGLLVERKV